MPKVRTPKPPKPSATKAAVDFFARRVPFTRAELEQLDATARRRAFFVSNVAQLRIVADVQRALKKAVAKGTTLQDFKREVGKKLEKAWGDERPAVVETIFRTNVQAAYNAGRLEQFEDPLVKRFRPMRGWAVILDGRTTEFICRPLATVIVPADSVFARQRIPPLHFRCRTGIMALSQEDADETHGVHSPAHLPDVKPSPGFGGDPRVVLDKGALLEDTPAPLRRIFTHKTSNLDDG